MNHRTGPSDAWSALVALALVSALAAALSVSMDGRPALVSGLVALVVAAFTIGRWSEVRRPDARRRPGHAEVTIEVALSAALARCRRFERPLALVRLDGVADAGMRRAVGEQVRATDEVCFGDDAVYVLMPAESEIGAMAWVGRLRRTLRLPTVAVAQFPVDGLTVDALLAHAASPEAQRPVADVAPVDDHEPIDRSAT